MSPALSSFLISVSIIVAIALCVPCIEALANLLRRGSQQPKPSEETAKVPRAYPRKTA